MKKLNSLLFLCLLAWGISAQIIDPNFNPIVLKASAGFDVLAQEDDKLLLVVNRKNSFLNEFSVKPLFRLNEDGSLDNTFDYPDEIVDFPVSMALQADGKILISGKFYDRFSRYLGSLLRLLPDGSIDPDFDIFIDESLYVLDIEVLEDQKIFLAASAEDQNSSERIYSLHLLEKDGQSAPNFTPIVFPKGDPSNEIAIASIASQSSSELLVAGSNLPIGNLIQDVYRLDASGQVDMTFNPAIESQSNIVVKKMLVSPSGIIGVLSGDDFNSAIFDRDGQVLSRYQLANNFASMELADDNAFYILGRTCYRIDANNNFTQGPETNTLGFRATRQSNNRLVAIGFFTAIDDAFTPGIVRFAGDNGFSSFRIDQDFQAGIYSRGTVRDIHIQEDGKIIIVGRFQRVNNTPINQIARLLPNGQIDNTFNSQLGNLDEEAIKIVQLPNGELIIGAERRGDSFQGKIRGLTRTDKNGFLVTPVPFNYFSSISGGSIVHLAMDAKNHVYAAEGSSYNSSPGGSGQRFQKYLGFGANLNSIDYNATYMDALKQFFGLEVQADDKLLIYGSGIRYNGSDSTFIVRALESGERDPSFFINRNSQIDAYAGHATNSNDIFVGGTDRTNTPLSAFLYHLSEDGQIQKDLSSKIRESERNFPRIQLIEGLPDDKLLLYGVFDEYDGQAVPNNAVIIDQEGHFFSDFLTEDEDAFLTTVAKIDDKQFYVGGAFATPNGAMSLARITDLKTALHSPTKSNQLTMGQISPNPMVTDHLQIEMANEWADKNLSYQIIHLTSGKIWQEGKLSANQKHDFYLPQLAAGAYSLQLRYQQQKASHLFIKSH